MYALRELKHRKKTFIPVICIAAGVMILMTNLLIYFQSEYTSDLAYYKTNTHLIMPNIRSDEADRMETLAYVDSIDKTADGRTYICFVKLKDEYLTDFRKYADCGVRIMRDLRLIDRSPYDNYWGRAERYGYTDSNFIGCGLFNFRYIDLMSENPVFNPSSFFIIFTSFLMYLAAVWLVFSMKVKRGNDEFASMRAMGASMPDLRRINQYEAVGITVIVFIPSILVSLIIMKTVCWLTENLYPDFGLNSLLTFDAPWVMIVVSFMSYILAAYAAVFIVTRHLKTGTVNELMRGTDEKVPFVEKSSVKLVNAPDFKPYFGIELKRTIKSYLPPQVLFCLLILFPMLIFGEILNFTQTLIPNVSAVSTIYSFESNMMGSDDDNRSHIPRVLVENILSLDGITGVKHQKITNPLPFTSTLREHPDIYLGENINYGEVLCSDLFDEPENVPPFGTCFAPAELYETGDILTFTVNNKAYELTVSEAREGLLRYYDEKRYSMHPWQYEIMISDETIADMLGLNEPMYQMVIFSCEKGRELELIPQIEFAAGYEHTYVNDHERQLRQNAEMNFTGSAVYVENEIRNFYDAFLFGFLTAETIFLLICAGSVIVSVTAYNVSGRNKEISVLRALGMYSDDIQRMSAKKQILGIMITLVLTYLSLIASNLYLDSQQKVTTAERVILDSTYKGVFSKIAEFLLPILHFAGQAVPACLLALIGYGACAYFASRKTVGSMLKKPVAEAVKNKE